MARSKKAPRAPRVAAADVHAAAALACRAPALSERKVAACWGAFAAFAQASLRQGKVRRFAVGMIV